MTVSLVGGVAALADRYDAFILDLWGTLHNGIAPLPGAVDALERLHAAGKRMILLSNAPRRVTPVVARMTEIGLPPGLYDGVVTSGEEAWQAMEARADPFYAALGPRCYHIGSARDHSALDGLALTPVRDIAAADFILNSGPPGWNDTLADYEELLQAARARDLPMVCGNPDLVVMVGDKAALCAGALAERYEAIGGRVSWHGKPFAAVYAKCLALLDLPPSRVLAVGDSLRTDIAGARGAGLDSLLVAGGIHAEEIAPGGRLDAAAVAAFVARGPAAPTYAGLAFAW